MAGGFAAWKKTPTVANRPTVAQSWIKDFVMTCWLPRFLSVLLCSNACAGGVGIGWW